MTGDMAQTPQPGFLAAWVNAFTAFDEAHGFAVNLFVVAALAADRRGVPDRPAAAGPPGGHRASRCCAWRTGC